jgi:protein-tyrosine phosphatase
MIQSNTSLSQPPIAEVDLHCHLLPDWDDGPRTVEDSLRLAAKAASVGIKKILVTPHVGRSFGSRPERASRDIAPATAHLQSQVDDAGIGVQLIPGAELTLSSVDFVKRVVEEPWLWFGGKRRYVLVESPLHIWPDWADRILFELSLQGITPIIAHPERLSDIQKDLDAMEQAVARGALLQITARSLVGSDRKVKDCCRRLLVAGLVSVVASDSHSAKHLMPGEVKAELCALVGDTAAHQMLTDNPRAILAGDPLSTPLPHASPQNLGSRSLDAWGGVIGSMIQRWRGG